MARDINTVNCSFVTVQDALLHVVKTYDERMADGNRWVNEMAPEFLVNDLRAIVNSIAARAVPDEAEQVAGLVERAAA